MFPQPQSHTTTPSHHDGLKLWTQVSLAISVGDFVRVGETGVKSEVVCLSVINLIMQSLSLWNWFVRRMWKNWKLWAWKIAEFYKQNSLQLCWKFGTPGYKSTACIHEVSKNKDSIMNRIRGCSCCILARNLDMSGYVLKMDMSLNLTVMYSSILGRNAQAE